MSRIGLAIGRHRITAHLGIGSWPRSESTTTLTSAMAGTDTSAP